MSRAINKIIPSAILAGIFLLIGESGIAQDKAHRRLIYNVNSDQIAAEGYDVVSYFMGQPRKGKTTLAYENEGIIYWFSNSENLDLFKKQPEKFEPEYGGWCAYAMGDTGEKVKIDPKTYKIIDGKLFLFYNFYFNNTLIDWNKDEQSLRQKADDNWHKINEKS